MKDIATLPGLQGCRVPSGTCTLGTLSNENSSVNKLFEICHAYLAFAAITAPLKARASSYVHCTYP